MIRRLSLLSLLLLTACGGGGGGGGAREAAAVNSAAGDEAAAACSDDCALTARDVETIIAQAVSEAEARDHKATIAVVDRVGNVLGIFAMAGADSYVTVTSTHEQGGPVAGGLEDLNFIPATMAAVSKAITGAYLSTTENAFTTRTASQIVQEHFNPGERDVPSGPLFGVQFSQLPCSDFATRGPALGPGPHRSPLGLSADPGGLPLYIEGRPVGGIGVVADGTYGLDKIISDFDLNPDELLATAGTVGYAAPLEIRADQVTLVGKTGRFSDARVNDLLSDAASALPVSRLQSSGAGDYVALPGYFAGTAARGGLALGLAASGIRPAEAGRFVDADGQSLDAFVFVDADNQERYPARDATDFPGADAANRLTAGEVQLILDEALGVANQSRAQIRVPPGVQARVTIAIVDTDGAILGMARTRDAPVFGSDVALQKARTATFFSGTARVGSDAPADLLRRLPAPQYLAPLPQPIDLAALARLAAPAPSIAGYVDALQAFLGIADALEATGPPVAFSDRAGGNLSRPHYPDGPVDGPHGPLSKPAGEWSVFSTGLQLDLVYNAVIQHVAFVLGATADVAANCTGNTGFNPTNPFTASAAMTQVANGLQIFPGSVPIYRGDLLVGGIGVSGDGVDQDDMISFLGVHRAGLRLGNGIGNAPVAIRADRLRIPGHDARLRYVNCPQLPFRNSDETEVCDGL